MRAKSKQSANWLQKGMLRLEGCCLNKEWLTQTLMTISKEDNNLSFKFDE